MLEKNLESDIVCAYNLSYLGGRNKRSTVSGQPGQKLARPYVKNKSGIVVQSQLLGKRR
jgi:hypothetical protein